MSLHPPIRICGFKTNTVCLLSGIVSCQPDWFPRKAVSVGWLLFNKCTVPIIQAFAWIPFACYGKNWIIFSLLNKNHHIFWIYNRILDISAKWSKRELFCLSCLLSPPLLFPPSYAQMSDVAEPVWLLCEIWRGQTATWSCYPEQPLLRLTSSQRHIYSGWH